MQNLSGRFVLNVGEKLVAIWMKSATYKNVKRSILKKTNLDLIILGSQRKTLRKRLTCVALLAA